MAKSGDDEFVLRSMREGLRRATENAMGLRSTLPPMPDTTKRSTTAKLQEGVLAAGVGGKDCTATRRDPAHWQRHRGETNQGRDSRGVANHARHPVCAVAACKHKRSGLLRISEE